MTISFKDKTVIISGASAGVGEACAEAFADQQANLVLLARGEQNLSVVATRLSERCKVLAIPMDVNDTQACADVLESAKAEFGSVDVLINNAGCHHRGPVEDIAPEDLANMIEVNLRSPIVFTRLALPYLRNSSQAAIVNVASLAGRTPIAGSATYSATKFGLRAFSFALGAELADTNIHVGVVSPGPIDTGFIMENIDEVADVTFSQAMSTSEQVAEAILSIARGEKIEIALPAASGLLGHLGYLFPKLNRAMRPALEKKGRKAKEFYRQRNSS